MNLENTFKKIMNLYSDKKFYYQGKEVHYHELLDFDKNMIKIIMAKVNKSSNFLFSQKINVGSKRTENDGKERFTIDCEKDFLFIMLLMIIDIMETAISQDKTEIHLDEYLK